MSINSRMFLQAICGIVGVGCCLSLAIPQEPAGEATESSLAISIAVPERVGASAPRPIFAFDRQTHFHVILTNKGREPLRVADPWSEQGQAALTFEIVDSHGNKTTARRPHNLQELRRPSLSGSTLKPGESVVVEVDFLNPEKWTGFPNLPGYGNSLPVSMRAQFEIAPDRETKEEGFWTGRTATELDRFTFESRLSGEGRGVGGVVETGNKLGTVHYQIEAEGPEGNLTLKRVAVTYGGKEIEVPAEAIKGMEKPRIGPHDITVENDSDGRPVLYVSFDLGIKTGETGTVGAPRVSYAFQSGRFFKRLLTVTRRHVVEEWPAK